MQTILVTDDILQDQQLILADGSLITIEIYFRPMQYGWFFNTISYGSWTLNGFRIVNSPNMLHQYKNQIPFGIACQTVGSREPMFQEDFQQGNSSLYLLNQTEIIDFSNFLSGVG